MLRQREKHTHKIQLDTLLSTVIWFVCILLLLSVCATKYIHFIIPLKMNVSNLWVYSCSWNRLHGKIKRRLKLNRATKKQSNQKSTRSDARGLKMIGFYVFITWINTTSMFVACVFLYLHSKKWRCLFYCSCDWIAFIVSCIFISFNSGWSIFHLLILRYYSSIM